jgi:hypothetical protein
MKIVLATILLFTTLAFETLLAEQPAPPEPAASFDVAAYFQRMRIRESRVALTISMPIATAESRSMK